MPMKNVWIVWRLNGDFMTTQVMGKDIPKYVQDAPDKASLDTWIKITTKFTRLSFEKIAVLRKIKSFLCREIQVTD